MKKELQEQQEKMFKLEENIHGFILKKEEFVDEIDGFARTFVHQKTGAQLVYISADDDNKVFSISFRTPSTNSTGVPHILEHSVLCGSKKYPVKEPFVELAKGSLNTFLNAMTYPDKTMYPIASTNAKDFMNLMDVYLDAVFYPNIYQNPYTFLQEGWHYHIENADDPIIYNGVVYNEMKGAFSNPEELLQNKIFESLYPQSCYRFESGGDPDVIPELTYADFLGFHKKYYHPSNSYIYLYGDGDVRAHLKYLNDEYLSAFDKQPVDSEIAAQPMLTQRTEMRASYGVSKEETLENKDYLALSVVLGDKLSYEEALAFDILAHILLNNNSSPLKEALLDLKIAEDVSYHYSSSLRQPYFSIVLKNTEEKNKDLFVNTVESVLNKLATDGLDPRSVEAGINIHEFSHIEGEYGSYPKGLIYGIEMMDDWLYGDDPIAYLKYKAAFKKFKDSWKDGYFEKLLKRMLIDNSHQTLVTIVPDNTLQEKADQALAEKLASFKTGLTPEELQALIDETQTLIEKQNEEDKPEDLEKIPKLSLADINRTGRSYPLEVQEALDTSLLFHPGFTGGISYLKLYFDYSDLPQEDLKYLSLMCKLLGSLSTESMDFRRLSQEIEIHTGGLSFGIESYDDVHHFGDFTSHCYVKGKAVMENIPTLVKIMTDVITKTLFTEKNLIHDMIREIKTHKETQFLTAGHVVGVQRLQSYYSQSARLFEEFGGIEFYRFIADLEANFDEQFEVLTEKLTSIASLVFTNRKPIISITGTEEIRDRTVTALSPYIMGLAPNKAAKNAFAFETEIANEGFLTAAKIQYVSQGYNIRALGYEYAGSQLVLKGLLSMDYLWNRVRVQGGAYGAFMSIGRGGDLYFGSYRDPKLKKTFEAYQGVVDYINNLELSQRELEKYIIGTISSKDVPLSASVKGEIADNFYFSGVTAADLQKERDEILETTVAQLKSHGDMIAAVLAKNAICVLGSEEAINEEKELFKVTRYIK
ncbi:insulinase family protein [Acetobacterium wieringae]|uniref:Insulinase family protein n=1 Tax=Acetobacterium wieringae TaxID=52694 RepID=A0ABY6HBG5_9FIRM|nr:insulinase family protein [Acetobacterium wieringae]UYO61680.1 insulinase family protein [Acetobacterium wieringae]